MWLDGDGAQGGTAWGHSESTVSRFTGPDPPLLLPSPHGGGGLLLSPRGRLGSTRLLLLSRTCFSYFQNLPKVPAHPEAQDKDSWHLPQPRPCFPTGGGARP